jgi:hypothetical protein
VGTVVVLGVREGLGVFRRMICVWGREYLGRGGGGVAGAFTDTGGYAP